MKKPDTLTEAEVRTLLRKYVERAGSLQAAAEEIGTTKSLLSETLNKKRPLGPRVLKALGIRKAQSYHVEK